MLSFEDYQGRILALATTLDSEDCSLDTGFGRVLTEDLRAKFPVPPFTNSAMDGFAVRSEDLVELQTTLRVVGDIPAGSSTLPTVGPGEAARIMTGAPLPEGADCVVPVEQTDQAPGDSPLPTHVTVEEVAPGRHVRIRGEDVETRDIVLHAGSVWSPAAAGAAASIGYATVPLRRKPKVAVLATGSELVPAGEALGVGQIPDSNSVLLAGLVEQFGGEIALVRTVPDNVAQFHAALEAAANAGADVIVTTGAVSAGAFEVVRQALGGKVSFEKVAMQPGKPQAYGKLDLGGRDIIFLGLPGNPVSVFVSAWVFLRPLLDALQGAEVRYRPLRLEALEGWKAPVGRRQFIPVVVEDEGFRRSHRLGSGSHLIASLHLANALAVVPEDVEQVSAGHKLDVYRVKSEV